MEALLRQLLEQHPEALARWSYSRIIRALLVPVRDDIIAAVARDLGAIGKGEPSDDFEVILNGALGRYTPGLLLDDYRMFMLTLADLILDDPDVVGRAFVPLSDD